ncbi:MAG: hypothetical protein FD161_2565 [Limisphaerales bacterium]|nr:MAG: hypothetical protein FD161_2565 [Limisphaerales bacterium]KAG0508487.1 MAG: hypothetical protein E1N63_2316 [Limisphaerales bacterium]TXT48913.1 MAG: hypothetical protein FD140_3381 [Limisphaerales bacterium]
MEIREAIGKLSLEERAEITAELCGWADDDWDRQMKRDVQQGKLSAFNRAGDAAQSSGHTRPLNEILREP